MAALFTELSSRRKSLATLALIATLLFSTFTPGQQTASSSSSANPATPARNYSKEIRGYKVELARVEIRRDKEQRDDSATGSDSDALIRLGEPKVSALTPFGITLEVPVTVAAVKQGGRVDFLTFEDMVVNGNRVTVNEYNHPFELPSREPVTLPDPVSIYISTPRVLLGAINEWNEPKEVWPVTGRVYVFGRFKKFLFKFKRVVPVELRLSFRNPLRTKAN